MSVEIMRTDELVNHMRQCANHVEDIPPKDLSVVLNRAAAKLEQSLIDKDNTKADMELIKFYAENIELLLDSDNTRTLEQIRANVARIKIVLSTN